MILLSCSQGLDLRRRRKEKSQGMRGAMQPVPRKMIMR